MSKQNIGPIDGGDLVVKSLLKEGITKVFGLVGGELLRIYDAIERYGREEGIDTVMVRHEQAAGHMADAWARATGKLGVCLGTAGPGVAHLVPAVAAAWADSIPLLVIGAQIARMFDDTGILQGGLDQMKLMEPITKLQISVEEPYEIPKAIQRAIKVAMSGRRGPVFLEFRETALVRKATEEDLNNILDPEQYRPINRPTGNPDEIKKAVHILKTAKKPLIIAGGGVHASDASSELQKLSVTYKIPCGTSINGVGTIDIRTETYVGSYLVANAYRKAVGEADVVISFGTKWDYTILFGAPPIWNPNAKVIQNDIDPEMIGRNRKVSVAIIGDAKAVINQLLAEMETSLPKDKITQWTEWNMFLTEVKKNDALEIQKLLKYDKLPMKPERFVYEVLDSIKHDSQLVIDGGDIAVFTFGLISNFPRDPRTLYFPITMGHLGTGIPHAIGAQIANPDKQVVVINGDGSFMFNVQELDTAMRLNLPIIVMIANNCAWGMIKSKQKGEFKKRYCDVDLPPTNYAEIAKGFGCYGEKIENPEDIKPAIQRAIDSKKPAVIDVDIAFETPIAMKVIANLKKNRGLYG
jgi:acetolactate synthase-1/2/3 large subunit